MDERKIKRCRYVTERQKKKLFDLLTKRYPELISYKLTQDCNYKDSQRRWQVIANELNAIPGARKTWKQWRKTWHDLRSKSKKRESHSYGWVRRSMTPSPAPAENEAADSKINSNHEIPAEFVPLEDNLQSNFCDELNDSTGEADTEEDIKLFDSMNLRGKTKMSKNNTEHSCSFDINFMAAQEERKRKMKEDYLNFKKKYLSQKLKLLKMQTEALTSIAKELSQ